jgi:hypothetical protein
MGIEIIPPGAADPITPTGSAAQWGLQNAPGAGTVIAATPSLPGGVYLVKWSVVLTGTLAAADEGNIGLFNGAGLVVNHISGINVGTIEAQPDVQVVIPAGGAVISAKAVAAATAGSVYQATIVATRIG